MKASATFSLRKIVKPLLTWFRARARSLPWRDDPRPYYVWVSEIMLQQTRVTAVMPYFSRFIAALPDVGGFVAVPAMTLLLLLFGEITPKQIALRGEVSSPIDPKDECRFARRCNYRCDTCKAPTPKLIEVEPNHWVACHCITPEGNTLKLTYEG